MESPTRVEYSTSADALTPISWGSIAAGAVAVAALTLALLALGAGLGLSSISPWADSGVSASTFKNATGIYLVCIAVMASAVGGYLSARMRTKWVSIHSNEAFFRDTAHGFLAWAFATVLSASALAAATTHIVGGITSITNTPSQQGANPARLYVDRLFRSEAPPAGNAPANNGEQIKVEVTRLWTASFAQNADLSAADRSYVARLVAAQTGISQQDAEKRVNGAIVDAKAAADQARRGAAKLAFWTTAYLLFGAFAAALAAVEGGQQRDGTWNDRRLVPRPW